MGRSDKRYNGSWNFFTILTFPYADYSAR
jgi:hypothetical protein